MTQLRKFSDDAVLHRIKWEAMMNQVGKKEDDMATTPDPKITHEEQVAGFISAKHDITNSVPSMFQGYIHDDMIQRVVYDVLMAAAKARDVHKDRPSHMAKYVEQPRVPMKTNEGQTHGK